MQICVTSFMWHVHVHAMHVSTTAGHDALLVAEHTQLIITLATRFVCESGNSVQSTYLRKRKWKPSSHSAFSLRSGRCVLRMRGELQVAGIARHRLSSTILSSEQRSALPPVRDLASCKRLRITESMLHVHAVLPSNSSLVLIIRLLVILHFHTTQSADCSFAEIYAYCGHLFIDSNQVRVIALVYDVFISMLNYGHNCSKSEFTLAVAWIHNVLIMLGGTPSPQTRWSSNDWPASANQISSQQTQFSTQFTAVCWSNSILNKHN